MNQEEVRYWISQLTVGDPIRQVLALRTLADSLDAYPEAVEAVIKRLREDSQSSVRQTAAHVLGEMDGPTDAVRQVLAWASANDDRFVSQAAAKALIKPKPPKE